MNAHDYPYERNLAPYACRSSESRGRRLPEEESTTRNVFQRDRDRIIHCTAFRRLEYKTQVFVNHEGDHYRTRLTHSIEVAQIARSVCRALRLHEDLAEAVSLAHDLGHTPFGHSGQDALDEMMRPYGGFEHNGQSLRVVEKLEYRYAGFGGLNLSYETREGIIKHNSPHDSPIHQGLAEYHLDEQATLEAQVANLADEIAYNNHDVDDGYRAGILDLEGLRSIRLFRIHHERVLERFPGIEPRMSVNETVRNMINHLISDVIRETGSRIRENGIESLDQVRKAVRPLVGFSEKTRQMNEELKQYLYRSMYQHYRVARMADKARRIVSDLFRAFMERPAMLPSRQGELHEKAGDEAGRARVIADYIAGMTDRYALEEHDRLFNVHARP
jgi:dGTPase